MKLKILISIILLSILFTGCSKREQLDERMIIQGVGIDRIDGIFNITIQQFSASGSSEKEAEAQVVKAKGTSVMEAFLDLSLQTGKDPMYSQNFLIVIGEDTAYNGVNDILDFFIRYYESRPTVRIIIAKGKAEEVLSLKQNDKLVLAKEIDAIASSEILNSKVMLSNLFQFVSSLKNITAEPNASAVSVIDDDGEKVLTADGTAIFNGDKLVGFMDLETTKGALLINNRIKNGTEVIDVDSVGRVTFSLEESKAKVKFGVSDGEPVYNIKIKVNTNIYDIEGDVLGRLPSEAFDIMQKSLEDRIKALAYQAIYKSVYEYGSDVFGFGRIALRSDKKYFKSIENNWVQEMKDSKYNVNVKVKICNTGQGIGRK